MSLSESDTSNCWLATSVKHEMCGDADRAANIARSESKYDV